MREVHHFIGGKPVKGQSGRFGDIHWAATNPQRRARVMFEFKRLVEANMRRWPNCCRASTARSIADSKGDIQRGLEVIEFACGIPHAAEGRIHRGAGPGIDVYSMRQPLGVVAGITPFNFPAMIPMWMFGVAIACGNTFILKPSERDPSVPMRLAELIHGRPAPAGVLNVVNGDKVAVDAILHHPDIKAVSFVGSSDIAQYIYTPAPPTESACRRWAAPRTTASSCPTPTWTRS
jgi:malonate-semialdehyde dehydrogenase (acetylating)/methylmalonate-semialdehyde dehydrogenase